MFLHGVRFVEGAFQTKPLRFNRCLSQVCLYATQYSASQRRGLLLHKPRICFSLKVNRAIYSVWRWKWGLPVFRIQEQGFSLLNSRSVCYTETVPFTTKSIWKVMCQTDKTNWMLRYSLPPFSLCPTLLWSYVITHCIQHRMPVAGFLVPSAATHTCRSSQSSHAVSCNCVCILASLTPLHQLASMSIYIGRIRIETPQLRVWLRLCAAWQPSLPKTFPSRFIPNTCQQRSQSRTVEPRAR